MSFCLHGYCLQCRKTSTNNKFRWGLVAFEKFPCRAFYAWSTHFYSTHERVTVASLPEIMGVSFPTYKYFKILLSGLFFSHWEFCCTLTIVKVKMCNLWPLGLALSVSLCSSNSSPRQLLCPMFHHAPSDKPERDSRPLRWGGLVSTLPCLAVTYRLAPCGLSCLHCGEPAVLVSQLRGCMVETGCG